jgi:uncharacterized protein (DUF983 family)
VSAWNRDTCLLPVIGVLLMAPVGFLLVGPLLWERVRTWPTWLAVLALGLATVVACSMLWVVGIRIARWWRRRRRGGGGQ